MYFENASADGTVSLDTKKCIIELIVLHYLDNVSDGEVGVSRRDVIDYVLSAYNNGKYTGVHGPVDEDFVSRVFDTEAQALVEFAPGLYRSAIDHQIMTGVFGDRMVII